MTYFISESTLRECFNQLCKYSKDIKPSNTVFMFLILKHIGFSDLNSINLSNQQIKEKTFDAVNRLASIAPKDESHRNDKTPYDFVNPLLMGVWASSKSVVSEPMSQWSRTRFKNNIMGGGQLWDQIYSEDEVNQGVITEKTSGLKKIFGNFNKIPVELLAIWFNRFQGYNQKPSTSQLINQFYTFFPLTDTEKNLIFSDDLTIPEIEYSDTPVNPSTIRNWLGNPTKNKNWITEHVTDDQTTFTNITNQKPIDIDTMISSDAPSFNMIKQLVDQVHQVILMGPPGTSKSYMAKKLSVNYDQTIHLQFHPQYSYQEFIGGKVLKNGSLVDHKGAFIQLLDQAIRNQTQKYLLIIDELNRANVSQVFGELIQLLDRDQKITLTFTNKDGNPNPEEYYLPNNLDIVATMNTTDRTVGRLDLALERRFYQVYFGVNYGILTDTVSIQDNLFSIAELLKKINTNLVSVLNNKEMVIGHASFLKGTPDDSGKITWSRTNFYNTFNFLVKPIVNDYCNNDPELINSVLGNLSKALAPDTFYEEVRSFLR